MRVINAVNDAPNYWKNAGGSHWNVSNAIGVSCSALRANRDSKWAVFTVDGGQVSEPASKTDEEIVQMLKDSIVNAMRRELAEVEPVKSTGSIATVRIVKTPDEYLVKAYHDADARKRYAEADYFTNDYNDAVFTAAMMLKGK